MATISSSEEGISMLRRARQRNKAVRSGVKTAIKAVRTAAEAGQLEDAQVAANKASCLLDTCSKGTVLTRIRLLIACKSVAFEAC